MIMLKIKMKMNHKAMKIMKNNEVELFEAEKLLAKKRMNGRSFYKVKWLGYKKDYMGTRRKHRRRVTSRFLFKTHKSWHKKKTTS